MMLWYRVPIKLQYKASISRVPVQTGWIKKIKYIIGLVWFGFVNEYTLAIQFGSVWNTTVTVWIGLSFIRFGANRFVFMRTVQGSDIYIYIYISYNKFALSVCV